MKNASQYARRLKTLFATVQREGTKPATAAADDPLDQLMRGILSRTASESRAAAAWSRLRDATVDLNELRVTPVSELVEIIGRDYPQARFVAEQISRTLHAIFNRLHCLNLDFMKSSTRADAESFLNGLDGIDAHARANVIMGTLGAHAIPVDDHMLSYLQRGRYVDQEVKRHEVQTFLERHIKARDGVTFYRSLKRYAATHSPRPPAARRPSKTRKKTARPKRAATTTATREQPATRTSPPTTKKAAARPRARATAKKTRSAKPAKPLASRASKTPRTSGSTKRRK